MDSVEKEVVQELRWDPILGEWVMVSNIREERPWQPTSFCPFCPGTEETGVGWDLLVLENKFPMLSPSPPKPRRHWFYNTAEARGRCLVLIETPRHGLDDVSDLPVNNIFKIFKTVQEEMVKACRDPYAVYFLYFRNKGREVGVSLTHPHAQIYILPFIPSKILRELINATRYYMQTGECIFCKVLEVEKKDRIRIVAEDKRWTAFIPYFAHWPFEVHIYPHRHVSKLTELSDEEIYSLSSIVKKVLCGFKNLFEKPMPYIMVLHQAPLRGEYRAYHLHVEIYGMLRTNGRMKYAAGMESGGGNFTYDSTPETAASMLRSCIVSKCSTF